MTKAQAQGEVRRWTVAYVVAALVAAVLCGPLFGRATHFALAVGAYLLVVFWLAAFIHLAAARRRTMWSWLLVVGVLSFAAPWFATYATGVDYLERAESWLAFGLLSIVVAIMIVMRRLRSRE